MRGYHDREKLAHQQRAWSVWHMAALMRWRHDRPLPPLADLLKAPGPPEPQTAEEMIAALDQWVTVTAVKDEPASVMEEQPDG